MVGLGGLEPPTSPLSGAFKVLYAYYFLREERRSTVARASLANNPTRSLYDKAIIVVVVLIADCVRARASSIRLKQARKVLDLRGASTFPWAAQS